MPHFRPLTLLGNKLTSIQSILAFEKWNAYPQFSNDKTFGRVALIACVLASTLGVHLVLCLLLILIRVGFLDVRLLNVNGDRLELEEWAGGEDVIQLALQWSVYVIVLCVFHLGEFFTTAVCNPSVTSADSFMVNHSKAYTAAALTSTVEFILRINFFPSHNSPNVFLVGILCVACGQLCRGAAMITCGESFNHYIQRDKKDNHVLVTKGIYSTLRHPSYTGFYYWAVGTQLILCNPLSTILYGCAAWTFFRYRIEYEEETLRKLFKEYEDYASRTYVGIPFL